MSALILKNIKKVYDDKFVAVKDFNLEIKEGEFVVFVGPSGCGKSTTLRMIAGLEEITEGELLIGDKLINDVAPKDRDIAMVFQNYALYSHMTVYHNMAFSLTLRRTDKDVINERVLKAAEILGITPYLNRKPANLSGGQRQRVALGRAMVRNANIFLFDEPLSNLDAKLRNIMRRELMALHQQLKTTMIYVTHDQIEALTLADRIVLMDEGVIQQVGTPLEVYQKPNNLFVAKFIGMPPMNIFDVEINEEATIVPFNINVSKFEQKLGEVIKKYASKSVFLGVRPEHLKIVKIDLDSILESDFTGKVISYELLGSEALVHISTKSKEIVARVNARDKYNADDIVKINFNPIHINLFDKKTENNLILAIK